MLAENAKSNYPVGGRLDHSLQGPHFKLSAGGENESSTDLVEGAMELRAAMQLSLHPSLRQFSSSVHFCFRDGCMSMAGVLPSYFLKQLTQEAVRNLEGVETIDNRICVESSYDFEERDSALNRSPSERPIRLVPR